MNRTFFITFRGEEDVPVRITHVIWEPDVNAYGTEWEFEEPEKQGLQLTDAEFEAIDTRAWKIAENEYMYGE